jgi:formate-dependent nitrite reductase membrane component NrfD
MTMGLAARVFGGAQLRRFEMRCRWVGAVGGGIGSALLIWDLEHPERFYMIFTRPQWKSWLVRGGFIIGAYGLVLALHLIASLLLAPGLARALAWAGLPLAAATAAYTAYLFAQSKARDLWQSPLLAPQMLVQAVLAGSAVLLSLAASSMMASALREFVAGSALLVVLFVFFETTMVHVTAHSRLGVWEMVRGRYAAFFWVGVLLLVGGVLSPWIGGLAALAALLGLLLYEHSYVQAAQAVPLA